MEKKFIKLFLLRDDKSRQSIIRAVKTLFFLIAMILSLLVFSAPVLLALADAVLPSALLSASSLSGASTLPPSPLITMTTAGDGISSGYADGAQTTYRSFFLSIIGSSFYSHLRNYDFRRSLVDIPLISIARSVIILCVYSCCDGPRLWRGPYLWAAIGCSTVSLVFVSIKALFLFVNSNNKSSECDYSGSSNYCGMEVAALFCCSYVLAVGHILVAYRTSCKERKKLLVYKIDVEAVSSACKNASFPLMYQKKLLQEERSKW